MRLRSKVKSSVGKYAIVSGYTAKWIGRMVGWLVNRFSGRKVLHGGAAEHRKSIMLDSSLTVSHSG
jgi:hypothetical protein